MSPGNEQREFWTSEAADTPQSENYMGIRDPVVDELVSQIIAAPDRASLVAHVRALDRVLSWGFYVIPEWYDGHYRLAYWDKFGRPETLPKYGLGLDTWWFDPTRAEATEKRWAETRR